MKKYSKDGAPEVKEDEGIAFPTTERYTYDPY